MKKLIKIFGLLLLGMFSWANVSTASETGGTIGTGVETGIIGVVIVPPTANVPSGTYASTQSVSLAAMGAASIRYTANGTDPDCSGSIYSAPITISATTTLKAISCYPNNVKSAVSSFEYIISQPPSPPEGGGGGGLGQTVMPAPKGKIGDINLDSKVNEYDFSLLMKNWGKPNSTADLNKDNKVDEYDFALLMASWG